MQQRVSSVGPPREVRHTSPTLVIGMFVMVLAALAYGAWVTLTDTGEVATDELVPDHVHTRGSASAPVSVVVFGDFQCPACAAFANDVQPRLESDLVDEGVVRLAYRHDPVLGRKSLRAAEASECVWLQGKFWEYIAVLYGWQGAANAGNFSDELLEQLALGVRVDPRHYRFCMDGGRTRVWLEADMRRAVGLGVTGGVAGLPAVLVNGARVAPPVDYNRLHLAVLAATADR